MSDESGKPRMPDDEDIAARFERIREQLHGMELPDLPNDEALRAKIAKVTSPSGSYDAPEVPNIDIRRPKSPGSKGIPGDYNYRSLGIGMSAAYSLVGSMAVGFGLGWVFDHFTHNAYGQVVGSVLGAVLGIVAAIILINRDGGGK